MNHKTSVLTVKNLAVEIHANDGIVHPVRNLSLHLMQGEILAIVGESGCGKSMLCKAIAGLLPSRASIVSGSIHIENEEKKNHVSMIFQDPMTSLDPTMSVGRQIGEAIEVHKPEMTKEAVKARAIELLELVGIENAEERYNAYPWNLSGGMRQRCVIAIALASDPNILIADEPTTALDVTIQAQILDLLLELREKLGLSILFITHDLAVVAQIADRVAIMYAGEIVEYGMKEEILEEPKHPYTVGLLQALPDRAHDGHLHPIPGAPPTLRHEIVGDSFAERNAQALGIDFVEKPPFFQVTDTHYVASWLLDPRAKDVRPLEHSEETHEFTEMKTRKTESDVLLDVKHLSHRFQLSKTKALQAVDDVSFSIGRGEIFSIVGESGSGKSTIARCVMGMLPSQEGSILYDGIELTDKNAFRSNKKVLTRDMQMIMQDSTSSLNQRMRVREIVEEPMVLSRAFSKEEMEERINTLLDAAKLDKSVLDRYPPQLSGGQRQRVAIVRAFTVRPKFIIADEPLASLDVSVQAQIVNLFLELVRTNHTAVLFIAHDLSMVKFLSDRVGVMHKGEIVEMKQTDELFANPEHAYTQKLLAAIPKLDGEGGTV